VKRSIWLIIVISAILASAPGCFGDDTVDAADADQPLDSVDDGAGDADADAATRRAVGEACTAPDECVADASCIGTSVDGRFICMEHCAPAGRLCADGSVCVARLGAAEPICYTGGATERGEACETNLDCVAGTLCFGVGGEHYCLDACHTLDADVCGESQVCQVGAQSSRGLCRHRLGEACDLDGDCAAPLRCSREVDPQFDALLPRGYCSVFDCTADADCPDGGVCRTLPDATRSLCMPPCAADADCRFNLDYRCLDDSYCAQLAGSDDCEAFRDDKSFCFPAALSSRF
jgi:hypothetical protein